MSNAGFAGSPAVVYDRRQELSVLKWWLHDLVSKEGILLASGEADQIFEVGTVFGQETSGATSAVAGGSNTGNGVFTGLANEAGAPVGAYALTCIQATSGTAAAAAFPKTGNTGTGSIGTVTPTAAASLGLYKLILTATGATAAFDVFTPGGKLVGSGNVATAFNQGGLSFTLANAGTMTEGDTYYIIVTDNDAAVFSVTDPNGVALPNLTVGTAYADEIAGTLSEGSVKFAVGDAFTVTLAAGNGKYYPLNVSAVNGTQIASAINYARAFVPASEDALVGAVVRFAVVLSAPLNWPAGITSPQIAAALAQLAAQNIFTVAQV